MLSAKEQKVIRYIIDRRHVTTLQLEEYTGKSTRSVRYVIKSIREKLLAEGIELKNDSKRGYYFSQFDIRRLNMMTKSSSEQYQYPIDHRERCYYIIGCLLLSEKVDKNHLASEIYVSLATISSDLRRIREIFETEFQVKLEFESTYTNCFTFNQIIYIFNVLAKRETFLNERLESRLLELVIGEQFDHNLLEGCYTAVKEIADQNATNFKLFQTTWVIYFILVLKTSNKRFSNKEQTEYQAVENKQIYQLLIQSGIELTELESQLFNKILISLGWKGQTEFEHERISKYTIHYFTKLQTQFDSKININGIEIDGLVNHLISLNQRLIDDLALEEVNELNVKLKFPHSYFLATDFCNILFEEYTERLTTSELSFVAVYFENILFTSEVKLRALLVCGSGLGMTTMIEKWVNTHFYKRVEIVNSCSKAAVSEYIQSSPVDVILTSVELDKRIPVDNIRINLLPTYEDLEKVEKVLANKRMNINYLYNIIDEHLIVVHQAETSFEKVIKRGCYQLAKYDIIDDNIEFATNVINREKHNSTYFGNGILVPHPIQLPSLETGVHINVLKNPIKVGNNTVSIIFLVVLSKKVDKNIVSLYELIVKFASDKELKSQLLLCDTNFEVALFISRVINNL